MSTLFTDDFRITPYWWARVPRPDPPEAPLPQKADGRDRLGLYRLERGAADRARRPRHLVLDAEAAGFGCSTRNGGQISTSVKPGFDALARQHGEQRALGILREGRNSLAWIGDFVAAEKIACDFRVCGRFYAAHNPTQYEALARAAQDQRADLSIEAHVIPRAEQRNELGTDAYFGGVVYLQHASVDSRAVASGHARACARCRRHGRGALSRDRAFGARARRFVVETPKGAVTARNVVVATNDYTGALAPWLQRRVIPIGSYIIATEPLRPDLMQKLMPKDRVVSDTRRVVYYYRASPDGQRILFGGRVSANATDPRKSGPRLHAELLRLFPELEARRISHSWFGFVAYTFDELAHMGQHDGLHYAMSYCGSGVGMAGYLGMRIGQQVLGRQEGATALDGLTFPTRPLYTGYPWFLGAAVAYYRWRDSVG
jgi:glycine/D-amino acid oxidase-like deaminating enzyme